MKKRQEKKIKRMKVRLSDPSKKDPVHQRNVKFSRKASENFKASNFKKRSPTTYNG